MVFSVTQPFVIPREGVDATTEVHHGYDEATGRGVLQETRPADTMNGSNFDMEMLQELAATGQ